MKKFEEQIQEPEAPENQPRTEREEELEREWQEYVARQQTQEANRPSFLELFRENETVRTLVAYVGSSLAAVGVIGGTFTGLKINEYLSLKEKKVAVENRIRELDPHDRAKKVHELYGDWVELDRDRFSILERSLEETEQALDEFSFLKQHTFVSSLEEDTSVAERTESPLSIEAIPSRSVEMDTSFLKGVIEKTFPKSWFTGEVSSVGFLGKKQELPSKYGIKGSEAWASFIKQTGKITFYEMARESYVAENISCLAHEVGHANDWSADNETLVSDRMELILDVADRLKNYDRFKSPYVEKIKNKDPKKELYLKATEYWAKICEVYFMAPSTMNIKDFRLVDDWVKKNDPDFNVGKSKKEREKMIVQHGKDNARHK